MIVIVLTGIGGLLAGAGLMWMLVSKRRATNAADTSGAGSRPPAAAIALGLVGVAAMAGAVVVFGLRPGPGGPEAAGTPHPTGDVESMVAQLEADLARNPGDAEGWAMLGWSYMRLDRPDEGAQAYRRAAQLSPGAGAYRSDLGEALTVAAGGVVTGEAREAFQAALALNPQDPAARFYLALAREQAGDLEGAVSDWRSLLAEAPPGSPLEAELRRRIEGESPGALSGTPLKGPSSAQVAQAQSLDAAGRAAMIEGMVEGLAARLEDQPRDAEGWATLMRSRMVLGQTREAEDAYRQALRVFANDAAERDRLARLARDLGLSGP